ncbi:MAG: TonB-dependent receptor [Tannerella sp.]|nr:TonB-dependent receptor [Tannerella sp.]
MKMTLILLCISVVSLSASVYSQDVKVSIRLQNQPVNEVFSAIKAQTSYSFWFDIRDVNLEQLVSINVKNETVKSVLTQVLKNQNVEFTIHGNHIIIAPIGTFDSSEEQQGIIITGTVSDDMGEPLPGVNISLKGTTTGVISDANGHYSISVPGRDAVLVFSYIGFAVREITVGNRTNIDVALSEDAKEIDEVVVIGYGTRRKADLTGSVVSANIKAFENAPNISIYQSLHGAIPGLTVSQTTAAGEAPSLSIRGTRSISGSSEPLIVVDGIIYRGSIVDINPNDIESVDILKDASSAAIYGSQSANGVMLITTKRGNGDGKPIIGFSGSYSLQSPTRTLRSMNSKDWYQKNLEIDWENSMMGPDYTTPNPNYVNTHWLSSAMRENYEAGVNTDWWDLLTIKNPSIQDYNVNIRARTNHLNYYVSYGYADQKNLMVNDTYKRHSFRVNIDNKIADWLTVGTRAFVSDNDYSGTSPNLRLTMILPPIAKPYDENGDLIMEPYWGSNLSPLLNEKMDDKETRLNLDGVFYGEIKIPWVEGLSYKINYSVKNSNYKHYTFNKWGANYQGTGAKYTATEMTQTLDHIVNYNRIFAQDHSVNATFVYGYEEREAEATNAGASIFTNTALGYNGIQNGATNQRQVGASAWEEASVYMMGRLFYGFREKYLFTGTIRRDGFSGFGENYKYGVFPSASAAWVVSKESFLKDNVTWLDELKLRVAYGVTGNRTLARYQTLATVSSQTSYLYGDGGSPELGQWVSSLPNADLKWEKTTGLNLGLDFNILRSKVTGNIEYYNTETKDMLYNINIPQINGFSTVATNIGELQNQGVEVAVSWNAITNKDFNWNITGNFSLNRNKVVTILGRDDDGDGLEDDLISSGIFIGKPLGVWYDYDRIGMWQLADKQAYLIPSGFEPGQMKVRDVNGDGNYTPEQDRVILGYFDPSYRFGIQNTLNYKNFSLMIFINSIQGGKNRYYGNMDIIEGNWMGGDNAYNSNMPKWDWWTPSNPNAEYPRLGFNAPIKQTYYVQRNFVRIQDISLSYNVSPDWLKSYKINNLRVYVSGQNLFTFTKWKGWDPETGTGLQSDALPVMRNFTFGLTFEF